jgi:hypothetical protein
MYHLDSFLRPDNLPSDVSSDLLVERERPFAVLQPGEVVRFKGG